MSDQNCTVGKMVRARHLTFNARPRATSSNGRATPLQGEGSRFESEVVHAFAIERILMLKRKTASAVTLLAVSSVVLAATAMPAAASFASCPSGQSCLYDGEWGTGTQTSFAYSTYHDGKCHPLILHPKGGYHSAHGGYGSNELFNIYSGSDCTGWLAGLANGADWDSSVTTVNSIKITP